VSTPSPQRVAKNADWTHCNTLQHAATRCNTHCNTLQHTTAHYNALQHTATHWNTHCSTLQHTATHTLLKSQCLPPALNVWLRTPIRRTATNCNTLRHAATHRNTLQHTATHCNTLQHIVKRCNTHCNSHYNILQHPLQHTATHCNTLLHTVTHTLLESQCLPPALNVLLRTPIEHTATHILIYMCRDSFKCDIQLQLHQSLKQIQPHLR